MSNATDTIHRKYSARVFTRAAMLCPRCQTTFESPEDCCPKCEFSLAVCAKKFPFAAPPLQPLIDPTRALPENIERDLTRARRKLRKQFPQVEVSFCFVNLPQGTATQEFAFWLHNSAPAADEKRAWHILVVGDFTSGRLALTTGYALEPYIKSDLWEAALQELAACIADEEWKEGLAGFLVDTRNLLAAAWKVAEQRRLRNLRKIQDLGKRKKSVPTTEANKKDQHAPPRTPQKIEDKGRDGNNGTSTPQVERARSSDPNDGSAQVEELAES